jgi:Sulfotransferase domain
MQVPSGKYAYIIGAQKSATSSLHKLLSLHPDIFFYRNEAAFFDKPTFTDTDDSRRQFAAFFAGRQNETVLGLKRPNYLHLPEVPERVKSYTPNARFIAILRDPVSRVVSAYYHHVRSSHLPVLDINEGMPKLLDGDWATEFGRVRGQITEYGFYADQLERWFEHFDKDQFLVFLLQDIKTDLAGVLRKCCRFLDVDAEFDFGDLNEKKKESVYSTHRLRVLQLASFRQMGQFNPAQMSPEDRLFLKTIRDIDRTLLRQLFPATKPKLTPDLKKRLQEMYIEDSRNLSRLIDRDLSHWSVFDKNENTQ